MGNRCTRTSSESSDPTSVRQRSAPITLRDLANIDVERLKGVGDKKRASLAAVGVDNLLDLVTTYPRRWVDRTNEARIADLVPGEEALVLVTVRSVTKRTTRNRRTMVNVNVGDGSGRMDVVFFNQPWRERQLREGLQVALFGKADIYRGGLQMSNPIVDLIGDRTGRIVPIYPQSEKAQINTWEMAGVGRRDAAPMRATAGSPIPVPAEIRRRLGLHRPVRRLRGHPPAGGRCARRSRPATASPSTSCSVSNWCSCCASGRWSASRAASPTTVDGDLVDTVLRRRCRFR